MNFKKFKILLLASSAAFAMETKLISDMPQDIQGKVTFLKTKVTQECIHFLTTHTNSDYRTIGTALNTIKTNPINVIPFTSLKLSSGNQWTVLSGAITEYNDHLKTSTTANATSTTVNQTQMEMFPGYVKKEVQQIVTPEQTQTITPQNLTTDEIQQIVTSEQTQTIAHQNLNDKGDQYLQESISYKPSYCDGVTSYYFGDRFDVLPIYKGASTEEMTNGMPNVNLLHQYHGAEECASYAIIMDVPNTTYDSLKKDERLNKLPDNPTSIRMVTQFVNSSDNVDNNSALEMRPYALFTKEEIDHLYTQIQNNQNATITKSANTTVFPFLNPATSLKGYSDISIISNNQPICIHDFNNQYLMTSGNSHQLHLTQNNGTTVPYSKKLVQNIQYLVSIVESDNKNYVTFHAVVPLNYVNTASGNLFNRLNLDFHQGAKQQWKNFFNNMFCEILQKSPTNTTVSQDLSNYEQFLQLFLKENEITNETNPFVKK
jgi:hypothetical protein